MRFRKTGRTGAFLAGVMALSAFHGPAAAQAQGGNSPAEAQEASYRLLADAPISFPFEIHGGDIRFRCELNGREVFMLLDDGFMWDELLLWGADVEDLDLEYTGELPPLGVTDTASRPPPSRIAEGLVLRLPGVEFTNETAIVSPRGSWYETAFAGSIGQVSGTFLKNFTVSLDFDRMELTLHSPNSFEYVGDGRAVPWEPMGFGPWSIPVSLGLPDGRTIELPVLMDLGYNSQLQIVTGGEHGFTLPDDALATEVQRGTGPETFYLARIPTVTIAGYEIQDVPVSFLPEDHHTPVYAEVMLGLNLISRFNVIYDFARNRMILEPNARFHRPFKDSLSGSAPR